MVYVINAELDDRGMVVSWTGHVTAEQLQRACASNCQGACRRFQLPEILTVHRHRDAGDLLVKARETLDIGGDDRIETKFMMRSFGGSGRDAV